MLLLLLLLLFLYILYSILTFSYTFLDLVYYTIVNVVLQAIVNVFTYPPYGFFLLIQHFMILRMDIILTRFFLFFIILFTIKKNRKVEKSTMLVRLSHCLHFNHNILNDFVVFFRLHIVIFFKVFIFIICICFQNVTSVFRVVVFKLK